ncbi:DUF2924 domain-containing protein [Novosphingobium sp.]|uniref:DUF2924 domain-containing protein n=1 Tax=Novosphingobium sp. TaxID=1874826 RepID=UPI003BAA7038
MSKIDIDLAELATLSPAQLRDRWAEVCGRTVPAVPHSMLRRGIAHALQERSLGGLSTVTRRTLEAVAKNGVVTADDLPIRLKPGTRLMRQWNGRMHSVLVTEEGFQFDGRTWASLSAIAERITGAHWSGPRFFGLRRPPAPPVQVPRHGQ